MQLLKKFMPIFDWLPNYKKKNLQGDLSAGLTVGIMLIPQGMAYAMLAGLDPIHGLYAVTVPILLYALFGTSRQLAVGPVAMVSLLTAAGIGTLNPDSPEQYLLYALTLAFLIGLIQFGMGILRFGFFVNFLSHPVINGFTSAAAIIIGLSQIKHLFGIELPRSEYLQDIMVNIYHNISGINWTAFGIGIAGIIIIKFGKKIHKSLPTPLLAVVFGILIVWGFNLTDQGVAILGDVPSGLPGLSSPSFSMETWSVLLPIAITISLVSFAESFAVSKVIQNKHKNYKLDANQELIGLGMANFGAAFFMGYPVTGGFSRTAVNDQSGAKTALASIISVALIVITLLFLTELFFYLPKSILAAVVIVAVMGLIDIKTPKTLWKADKTDFILLMTTFVSTLTLGIVVGIIIGMVLSLIAVLYKASRPHMAKLAKVPDANIYRNTSRFEGLKENNDELFIRIDGQIYFANISFIQKRIEAWEKEKGNNLKKVILNFESVISIDSSGAHEIEEWIRNWHKKGIQVAIAGARGPVRDILKKWNMIESLGKENIFVNMHDAVLFLNEDGKGNSLDKKYALQSNV
ncbi:sodium-independent anion transporter [Brumimicrobium salinarum]|uniref:Sodium-independent anion transporter n=1 Tax=Brumimicrobium salinarum TaxID=2058658 RepID=A0A2I0R2Z1_9FLAO|nr:solute carrier family 26 protein [Brumimicrobium salinarum]PKR80925.1 sodium-independent anion transporter [Brumimicrobium salinarum]